MTRPTAEQARLYLSDLHLVDAASAAFSTLEALLRAEAPAVDAVYFLGDLCEAWVGDDDDGPLATELARVLGEAAGSCDVFVMHGNRDFLLGPAFAERCGCGLIEDPTRLDDGTLLAHGDGFCIDDEDYQQLRTVLRSAEWQTSVLDRPLAERRALAERLRAESRSANANKAANIMDVAEAEVERVMRSCDANILVHGHTHRPGIHRHAAGARYVLGAWERCGWLIRQQGAQLSLECFPLTGRYESAARGPAS